MNPHIHDLRHLPVLVSTAEAGKNHVAEAAGSVQFGLTLGPLDGALQPSTEETLEHVEEKEKEESSDEERQMGDTTRDVRSGNGSA